MNLQEIAVSFDNLDLLASQVVEGFITGMHKSPFHGFSVEFAEHRLYNTGESTKNIDWKLFGRTDKLFVKRFDEETNLRCHLLLDVSPSMYYPKDSRLKIRFASIAAAVLANLMKNQRDAFGLFKFSDKIVSSLDIRSSASHYNLVINELQKSMAEQPAITKTNVAATLDEIAELIHRRSLVVIFSDMFDASTYNTALFDALQHLKFRKHEVILFHIVDGETELEFNFDNRPYKFVDSESGEELKLYPDDVREIYLKRISEFRSQLRLKCNQYKIDYVEADVRKDFSQILLPFFAKRARMK
ncbi:MAG: DUF58 domain-containing protein [Bacteroidia bacterium]|nr:DUF58 domain-containing protein [Bacteroidia bacterium]